MVSKNPQNLINTKNDDDDDDDNGFNHLPTDISCTQIAVDVTRRKTKNYSKIERKNKRVYTRGTVTHIHWLSDLLFASAEGAQSHFAVLVQCTDSYSHNIYCRSLVLISNELPDTARALTQLHIRKF